MVRKRVPLSQKEENFTSRRLSGLLLPIGKLVKNGAIFRRQSEDGAFERNVTFGGLFSRNHLRVMIFFLCTLRNDGIFQKQIFRPDC